MSKNNINITFFCGGSGCTSFIKYLENFKDVNINLIINGYDYGKSSGKIRKTFPMIPLLSELFDDFFKYIDG